MSRQDTRSGGFAKGLMAGSAISLVLAVGLVMVSEPPAAPDEAGARAGQQATGQETAPGGQGTPSAATAPATIPGSTAAPQAPAAGGETAAASPRQAGPSGGPSDSQSDGASQGAGQELAVAPVPDPGAAPLLPGRDGPAMPSPALPRPPLMQDSMPALEHPGRPAAGVQLPLIPEAGGLSDETPPRTGPVPAPVAGAPASGADSAAPRPGPLRQPDVTQPDAAALLRPQDSDAARPDADRANPARVAVSRPGGDAAAPATPEALSGTELAPSLRPAAPRIVLLTPPGETDRLPRRLPGRSPEAAAPAPESGEPAWQAWRARFDDASGRPLVSVLLELDPAGADVAALSAMNLPVSFVIPSDMPDAAVSARSLRAAGHEVFVRPAGSDRLTSDMPEAAIRSRVADALGAVPEAVGIVDLDGDLSRDPRLAAIVTQFLADSGQAAVTERTGAGNAYSGAAAAEGAPHLTLDRMLGEGDEDVRATLDAAAFSARQSGHAVVYGTAEPETLREILSWALTRNNRQVTLAPGSAQIAP